MKTKMPAPDALILAIKKKKADEPEPTANDSEYEELSEIASDLLSALEKKDATQVKDLLKEFFMCCESYPHEES